MDKEMQKMEALNEVKAEYMNVKAPEHGLLEMQKRMEQAKKDKRAMKRKQRIRSLTAAAAAVLVLCILPNTNAQIAHAMENIPVLGAFFKVVTVREYQYEDDSKHLSAKVPQIQSMSGQATGQSDAGNEGIALAMELADTDVALKALNQEISAYVDALLDTFETEMKEKGYKGLDINYTTITDTENWFTLEINAVETAASGYEFRKYYHIDKQSGQTVTIRELLQADEEKFEAVSEEILRQMQEQMDRDEAFYFLKSNGDPDGFETITETQNFYFNSEGSLVIVFDEYEVAPGAEGCPQFIIPDEVWK